MERLIIPTIEGGTRSPPFPAMIAESAPKASGGKGEGACSLFRSLLSALSLITGYYSDRTPPE